MESTEHTSQDTETEMSTIRRRAPKPRRLTILHEVRSGRVFIPSAADGNHHWLARRYPWLRQGAPWRVRMHNLIEEPRSSRLAAIVYLFLMSLVLISAIVLCLDTLPQYEDNTAIFAIECVCATFFSIEFATRLLSWQDHYVSIIWSPSIYIDLLSVMPFFIQQILGDDSGSDDGAETADGVLVNSTDSGTTAKDGLQVIGIMRLLRLLRLLKLVRHYEGSAVLANALERSLSALLVPLFFLTLLCFVFAGLIYYIEGVISDNEDFDNIFKSAWFVLVTLSTVGYGDISPVSWYGKVVTVPMIICGVLFMAMPITIVGNNFTVVWEERQVLFVVAKIHMLLKQRSLTELHALEVFREMDADGDGSLDIQEFRRALGVMGIQLQSRQLAETFHAFDGDMDGSVDYAEFCEKVFPTTERAGMLAELRSFVSSPGPRESMSRESATRESSAGDGDGDVDGDGEATLGLDEASSFSGFDQSVLDIRSEAREASDRLQADRVSAADKFAVDAEERLSAIERNLARIAKHLGVALEPEGREESALARLREETPKLDTNALNAAAAESPPIMVTAWVTATVKAPAPKAS